MLTYDESKTTFIFKFDETTTSQTKKQHDGYLQFYPKKHSEIINAYCGSLFTLTSVSRLGLD